MTPYLLLNLGMERLNEDVWKMKIGLDYDGTVTADPVVWYNIVKEFLERGHEVKVVTFRSFDEVTQDLVDFCKDCGIAYITTGRIPKAIFCAGVGWQPDIWIDDNPGLIGQSVELWDDTKLAEWRESLSDRLVEESGNASGRELFTEKLD
jgi:hypothetical protein